jgi:hypothetical protein
MLHYLSYLWSGFEVIIIDYKVQMQFLSTTVLLLRKNFIF